MKREEIYIGQKVVPISKTGKLATSMDTYFSPKFSTPTARFLKDNNYAIVKSFDEDQVILGDGTAFSGDYFLPQDLIPYKTKKENNKMEKKMTKAELEGKWVEILEGDARNFFNKGDILQIKGGGIESLNGEDTLRNWYNNLPNLFTFNTLKHTLESEYSELTIKYLGTNTKNKPKPDSAKITNAKTDVNVDMFFSKPVIEETKEEVFIFSGRVVTYFNKELGIYGVATCHENELKSYSREVGKALAYYRAFKTISKGGNNGL